MKLSLSAQHPVPVSPMWLVAEVAFSANPKCLSASPPTTIAAIKISDMLAVAQPYAFASALSGLLASMSFPMRDIDSERQESESGSEHEFEGAEDKLSLGNKSADSLDQTEDDSSEDLGLPIRGPLLNGMRVFFTIKISNISLILLMKTNDLQKGTLECSFEEMIVCMASSEHEESLRVSGSDLSLTACMLRKNDKEDEGGIQLHTLPLKKAFLLERTQLQYACRVHSDCSHQVKFADNEGITRWGLILESMDSQAKDVEARETAGSVGNRKLRARLGWHFGTIVFNATPTSNAVLLGCSEVRNICCFVLAYQILIRVHIFVVSRLLR